MTNLRLVEDNDDLPGMVYPDETLACDPPVVQTPRRTSSGRMMPLRDVIKGVNGGNKQSFQQRLARLAEKTTRQREPEYDGPPSYQVPDRARPIEHECSHCKYMVNETDTHGWFKDPSSGRPVPCPVCSPVVDAARARRITDQRIKKLVRSYQFFNMQNLPPDSAKLTLDAYPQRGDQGAKRVVAQFIAARFGELLLVGEPGLGKTGLAISAVKLLTAQGKQALFLPMSLYVDLCREDLDFHNQDKTEMAEIATLVDILVIDDMGLEITTKKTVELTQKLIEARHTAGRRTLITSNMDLPGLAECWSLPEYARTGFQPGKRTIDRMENWYKVYKLSGSSLRKGV